MTKEVLAKRLDGRMYGEEITSEDIRDARESNLVVIYGSSDDLCELEGAISEEVGVYNGGTVRISSGHVLREIEREEREILSKHGVLGSVLEAHKQAVIINALWCQEAGYSWTYETKVPHATFDVFEGMDEKFCRGIVIDLKDVAR